MTIAELRDKSSAELRLDLQCTQAERCHTLVAIARKRNRIQALTDELLRRGSF